MRIWDQGSFQTLRWEPDHLTFRLYGAKRSGSYALIRFPRAGPDQWLFFNHGDQMISPEG